MPSGRPQHAQTLAVCPESSMGRGRWYLVHVETLNIGQDIIKRCHPDALSTLKHWLSVLRARWEEVGGTQYRETLNIGQDIIKRCHPDALSTLKHWLSVLRARWEEVGNTQYMTGHHQALPSGRPQHTQTLAVCPEGSVGRGKLYPVHVETLNIGQDIIKRCHPDALSTLKHWLSVLRARWEEVGVLYLFVSVILFISLNIGQDIIKRCHPDALSTLKHWLSVLRARWEEVGDTQYYLIVGIIFSVRFVQIIHLWIQNASNVSVACISHINQC